jgi:hypothetical protein
VGHDYRTPIGQHPQTLQLGGVNASVDGKVGPR